jgi:hypothetical protein
LFKQWGKVIETGIKGQSLIQAAVPVVYSDVDGDGYDELATVTVATTVTDKEEIAVFFPGTNGEYSYEIRPVDVSLAAGVATITFQKYLAPFVALWEKLPSPDDPVLQIDGDDNSNFVTTVDVYRVYNDISQQVLLYSEPTCSGTSQVESDGCLYVRNSRLGILAYQQATFNVTTQVWSPCTSCTKLHVRAIAYYRAGLKNVGNAYPHLRMKPDLARLICYYALTLADKPICGCDSFTSQYEFQITDLAEVGEKKSFQNTEETLNNPLGTKRAAINMWKYILKNRISDSVRKGY